ncbi:transcriptional regulator, AraC family [Filimonas lacunae]|uniref:Transcriptional regulator, AraC family n=1 Tax=Filimonas lacunae TaxID=477680 RepID=A0A173MFC4_9BACT|nr:response regulator transcription factor [Filimonas lacunae]BAV06293.1 transcriptional regulator, AraC family [Filimonas lacunae]SIT25692.1 transcriptional regulator, AraC family [Filimonas lacunae]
MKPSVVHEEYISKKHGFSLNCSEKTGNVFTAYSRKDFYKVCFYHGECQIDYADRGFRLTGKNLFFGTPHIPYAWNDIHKVRGISVLFTEEFLKTNNHSESLQQSPLFKIGGTPIFPLNDKQAEVIVDIFEKMLRANSTDYIYIHELIRNYINLLIHEALQMQPSENYVKVSNGSSRVTSLFLELLERQFPIESQANPLKLRNAHDFASSLSIHVNHLNRSVKEVTGKPTSAHITDRIITEAKSLLKHTNWGIAEIAYSLGFEYPTYFNNYFKRYTDRTPTAYRD